MIPNDKPADQRPGCENTSDGLALPPLLIALLRQAAADPMSDTLADWHDLDIEGRKP